MLVRICVDHHAIDTRTNFTVYRNYIFFHLTDLSREVIHTYIILLHLLVYSQKIVNEFLYSVREQNKLRETRLLSIKYKFKFFLYKE